MKSFMQSRREEESARRTTEANNRAERDRQIGMEYIWCSECGAEAFRSQYGADEYCPNCGAFIDWVNGTTHKLRGEGMMI